MLMPKVARALLPGITGLHRWMDRLSGGRQGSGIFGIRFLMLEHIGRKTGLPRTTPLLYIPHEGTWLIAASNAGQDHHPAWWFNLRENPDVAIRIGRKHIDVRARRVLGEEEEALWQVMIDGFSWFEEYRAGTQREIPLIVLERR